MKQNLYFLLILIVSLSSNSTLSESNFFECKQSKDCKLVQEKFCGYIEAINKLQLTAWDSLQKKRDRNGQTCSLLPAEPKMADYKVICNQGRCESVRTRPWR